MSLFRVADEHELLFEPLEEKNIEAAVWAHHLYNIMGHRSAHRKTDGRITRLMMAKRCVFWPKERLDAAVAALVELGAWTVTEDGWQVATWAPIQQTASDVDHKRELAAARKRAQRERMSRVTSSPQVQRASEPEVRAKDQIPNPPHETIGESGNVTRDVTASPAPAPTTSSPTEKKRGALASEPKKARPRDERRALWDRLLGEAAKRHGFIAVKLLTATQTATAMARAVAHAETAGVELEAAMVRLLDESHAQHLARGKDLKWCLVDWQPGAPMPKQWGKPKLEIAGCSPASSFGTEEEARARLEARKAARAAAAGAAHVA